MSEEALSPDASIPNPDDWTDTNGAAQLIGRKRATVYDLVRREVLHRYYAGDSAIFWVPECREIGAYLKRLRMTRGR